MQAEGWCRLRVWAPADCVYITHFTLYLAALGLAYCLPGAGWLQPDLLSHCRKPRAGGALALLGEMDLESVLI